MIVLILNKSRLLLGRGAEVQYRGLTMDINGHVVAINLYYHFKESFGNELSLVMTGLEVGGLYCITGEVVSHGAGEPTTLYYPDYYPLEPAALPPQKLAILLDHVDNEDLYFRFSAPDEEWCTAYNKEWLARRLKCRRATEKTNPQKLVNKYEDLS